MPQFRFERDDLDKQRRGTLQLSCQLFEFLLGKYLSRIEQSSNPVFCTVQPIYSKFIFEKHFYFVRSLSLSEQQNKATDTYVCHCFVILQRRRTSIVQLVLFTLI